MYPKENNSAYVYGIEKLTLLNDKKNVENKPDTLIHIDTLLKKKS